MDKNKQTNEIYEVRKKKTEAMVPPCMHTNRNQKPDKKEMKKMRKKEMKRCRSGMRQWKKTVAFINLQKSNKIMKGKMK